jgi:hypothetical protein
MRLREFRYSEEPGGTFTHDGKKYLLNPLLSVTRNFPINEFSVDSLKWILDLYDDGKDVDYADTSVPILIGRWGDKFVVLDGYHRLKKATQQGLEIIPGKFVDDELLSYFRID